MTQPAVEIDPKGIKLYGASSGRQWKWPAVNIHLAELLNPTLAELAGMGVVALYSYGIISNRPVRGRIDEKYLYEYLGYKRVVYYPSKHSEGMIKCLSPGKYRRIAPWPDDTIGSRAIDIRKVLFEHGGDCDKCGGSGFFMEPIGNSSYETDCPCCDGSGGCDIFHSSLVVDDPDDLAVMIRYLEKRGFKLHHKKLDSVSPYHLHLEVPE
jgi:hypothetical protein